MATITTRSTAGGGATVKGAPLTNTEVDTNFINLNTAKVETGGALGTPSSGVVTNLTGTASININGTVGATTANTGAFTTATLSSNLTLNGGTANGVLFLNGSKVASSGSALTFDGTTNKLGFQNAAANGYAFIQNTGAGTNVDLAFYQGATEAMRLTSTGLGIGTSSPGAALDVIGNIRVSNGSTFYSQGTLYIRSGVGSSLLLGSNDVNGYVILNTDANLGLNVSPGAGLANGGGNLTAKGVVTVAGPLQNHQTSMGVLEHNNSKTSIRSYGPTAGTGYITFNVGGGGNSNDFEAARISTDGTFRVKGAGSAGTTDAVQFSGSAPPDSLILDSSGRLGVGTSSPTRQLQVSNASNAIMSVKCGTVEGVFNATTAEVNIGSTSSNYLSFETNGSSRARISSDGTFRVKGAGSAGTTDAVQFSGSAPANSLVLNSTGNLGVGGSSPSNKFEVQSSGSYSAGVDMPNAQLRLKHTIFPVQLYAGLDHVSRFAYVQASETGVGYRNLILQADGGNLGIGTSSPSYKLDVQGGNIRNLREGSQGGLQLFTYSSIQSYNAPRIETWRARGTEASPSVVASGDELFSLQSSGYNASGGWNYVGGIFMYATGTVSGGNVPSYLSFETSSGVSGTERMRLTSSGDLLVGTTTANAKSNVFNSSADASQPCIYVQNNKNFAGIQGVNISAGNIFNDTGHEFLSCNDIAGGGTTRMTVRSNGGIANFSANNVNLSDARLKRDFTPSQQWLDKLCQIEVGTFFYKDQTDNVPSLGALAQQVEAVAPELVDASGFGKAPEGEEPYKAIYQTDMQYAMLKAIQEQQALITALTARIAALEAA